MRRPTFFPCHSRSELTFGSAASLRTSPSRLQYFSADDEKRRFPSVRCLFFRRHALLNFSFAHIKVKRRLPQTRRSLHFLASLQVPACGIFNCFISNRKTRTQMMNKSFVFRLLLARNQSFHHVRAAEKFQFFFAARFRCHSRVFNSHEAKKSCETASRKIVNGFASKKYSN